MSPVELSRRALVAGVACVAVTSSSIAAGSSIAAAPLDEDKFAWPGAAAVDVQVAKLWERRQTLAGTMHAALIAAREGYARIPEWARPGPSFLHSDGIYRGPRAGWPRIEGGPVPEGSAMINKRPSPYDIEQHYKLSVQVSGKSKAGKKAAKKIRDRQLAEFKERVRLQRAEEQKAGLPELERASTAATDRFLAVESKILGLTPRSPHAIAAGLLIDVAHECQDHDSVGNPSSEMIIASRVLEALRPHLRGVIRSQVDELLDNRSMSIGDMAFWPHSPPLVGED